MPDQPSRVNKLKQHREQLELERNAFAQPKEIMDRTAQSFAVRNVETNECVTLYGWEVVAKLTGLALNSLRAQMSTGNGRIVRYDKLGNRLEFVKGPKPERHRRQELGEYTFAQLQEMADEQAKARHSKETK